MSTPVKIMILALILVPVLVALARGYSTLYYNADTLVRRRVFRRLWTFFSLVFIADVIVFLASATVAVVRS